MQLAKTSTIPSLGISVSLVVLIEMSYEYRGDAGQAAFRVRPWWLVCVY